MPMSSTPHPGNPGASSLSSTAYVLGLTGLLKIGLLGACGHGDISRVAAFGHKCVRVASCAFSSVVDADIDGNVLQGSRPRCLCRFFCCTFFIILFLVAAIVLSLLLVRLLGCASQFLPFLFSSSGYDPQILSLEVVITAQ
jgi:hypothetical protein